jgi:hypothetical protein
MPPPPTDMPPPPPDMAPPGEPMPPPGEAMPQPPPPPPPAPVAVAATAPPSTVDQGVVEDANAGRGWLAPTALTPPAGTWSFSDFELFVISAGYAVTDKVQVSATTLIPIVSDMPTWVLLNGKAQIIRAGKVRGAVQAALTYAGVDGDSATALELGGALTFCIDEACHSHISGFLGAGFAHEDQSAVPFMFAFEGAFRVGKHLKLILEADSGFVAGEIDAAADGFLAWYGVRFTSSFLGVDLGFMKPICDGCESDELPMGFPFVSFTYRNLN